MAAEAGGLTVTQTRCRCHLLPSPAHSSDGRKQCEKAGCAPGMGVPLGAYVSVSSLRGKLHRDQKALAPNPAAGVEHSTVPGSSPQAQQFTGKSPELA